LRHVIKCIATDSSFTTRASCSKSNPCARMNYLTRVTRELVTLRSTAAFLMLLAALKITLANSQRCKRHQQRSSSS